MLEKFASFLYICYLHRLSISSFMDPPGLQLRWEFVLSDFCMHTDITSLDIMLLNDQKKPNRHDPGPLLLSFLLQQYTSLLVVVTQVPNCRSGSGPSSSQCSKSLLMVQVTLRGCGPGPSSNPWSRSLVAVVQVLPQSHGPGPSSQL